MHSRQRGSTYGACGPFTRNKERTKKKIKKQETQGIFLKMN